jgi:CubicO group peptidase (beta-lactamase class C family)
MRTAIEHREISGAVTVVVSRDRTLHCSATGLSDIAAQTPMTPGTLFWIASMTKPITATAVLMLQDEVKLSLSDPVSKFIPEFKDLKTPAGKPANLTLAQLLTHTSGLAEAGGNDAAHARTLADLIPLYLRSATQFEPGSRWSYCQSSINTAARIVEIVGGQSFDTFLDQRLFLPLGMTNTTFYPSRKPAAPRVVAYRKNSTTGALEPVAPRTEYGQDNRPPLGNGGLYSTGPDYARFCQMLLSGGTLEGRRYLSPQAMTCLATVQTGDLPTGFLQSNDYGNLGANYGWGIGTCVLKTPHPGVAAMLSPGSYGHGGAWGTQAWIDPSRGVAYILMVQRSDFPNSDASTVRRAFQQAAANALRR